MTKPSALRNLDGPDSSSQVFTPGGASASVEGDTIVIRDVHNVARITFDAATDSATLTVPGGDLHLRAGRNIVLSAGADIEMTAEGRTRMRAAELAAEAHDIDVSAAELSFSVGRWSLSATRVLEHVGDAYRHVDGVLQTRAGRLRMLVRGATQLFANRTSIVSEEDTSVDGKHVLLG